jgi:hypothetical protein
LIGKIVTINVEFDSGIEGTTLDEAHQRVDEVSGKKGYIDRKGREFKKRPFFDSVCERVVSIPSDGK